jgi:hypothetical protein
MLTCADNGSVLRFLIDLCSYLVMRYDIGRFHRNRSGGRSGGADMPLSARPIPLGKPEGEHP